MFTEHTAVKVKIEKNTEDVGDKLSTDETEPAAGEEDPTKELYTDHEIKLEKGMVIGPVVLNENVPTHTLVKKEVKDDTAHNEVKFKIRDNTEDVRDTLVEKGVIDNDCTLREEIITENVEVMVEEMVLRDITMTGHNVKIEKDLENVENTLDTDETEPVKSEKDPTQELYTDHEIKEEKGMVIGPTTICKRFECVICSKDHSTDDCLQHPMRTHTGVKFYESDICNKQFITMHAYENHNSMGHKGKFKLDCHLPFHTGKRPYVCDICNKTFVTKMGVKRHITTIHSAEKPFACVVCDKRYAVKYNLRRHMKLHRGYKPFACDVCEKRFVLKSILKQHMKIHSAEKLYACDVCDKRFTAKRNLRMHKKLHSADKPFACDLCDKRYVIKHLLTRHMKLHSADKPFACDICDKKYPVKGKFTRDKKLHSTDKPFACDSCDKRFALKSSLNRHMKCHSEDKPSM